MTCQSSSRTRSDPAVLAIVGPTGTGKSAAALALAEQLGAEVVAADAFTVYRGMDVGTAKPTRVERARVPHHMIDVLDPTQECTVQWFQQAARGAIAEVLANTKTPLLVGGSGLYFRAVVDPLEFPPTDPAARAEIEARYRNDPAAAHSALCALDPAAAARIDPGNLRRCVRALEVIALTGRAFSDWRRAWETHEPIYSGLRVAGLHLPRDELVRRLDARIDRMVAHGLVDECRALAACDLSSTARQGIGYAEILDHLAGRCDLGEAVARAKVRTRRYAARQGRWFAADPRVRWTRLTDRSGGVPPGDRCEAAALPHEILEVLQDPCGS
ncbi:MAG: tRNA (adenosine(37)-N6)-dimethylallyltransferase MiaA [Egibacteraceae bacterium]